MDFPAFQFYPAQYNPGNTAGGFAQGISQAGGAVAEGIQKYEEDKAKVGMADTVMDQAKDIPGAVSPEALARYHQANAKEKAYIAMGAQANLANMYKQQQLQNEQLLHSAQALYYAGAGRGAAGPQQPPGDVNQQGDYFWNGRQWIQRRAAKPAPPSDDFATAQQAAMDAEIAKHKVAIAQGNTTFHNPNAWFDFWKPRADRIAELERAKAAIAQPPAAGTGAAPTGAPPGTGAAPPTAGAGAGASIDNPVRVAKPGEAQQLPPGTYYTPDGQTVYRIPLE